MLFEPLIRTRAAWSSVFDRFAVHLFEGQVTVNEMDEMQRVGERWNKQHPGKRVEMVVIFPSSARMSLEERSRMARLIKVGEAHRTASATVILAQGMLGSMQRSMLTGLMMIAPPPHPAKVFGAIGEALTWLEPQLRTVCNAGLKVDELGAALQEHVEQFRRR
ncbi:MAG TPA: hypothetical protein VJR89_41785 [Polyangiales bacterium]|nr:hypothetical protein [Polyangiales bacterium]